MKTYKPDRHDLWLCLALALFSALVALFAVENIKISPDSMRFGLVSQQILSGNGIRVPIMRLEDTYVPVNGAIPFLDQLPLLPIIFALLGGVTPQNFLPAQIVNVVCHVTIAVFTFLLMKNLCNSGISLLAGMLISFSYPLLLNAHHMWSEPLFIALIVTAIFFLTLSRDPDRCHFRRHFFIAGICASAAILTRNAGIALIPVFLWEAFMLVKNKRPEYKYLSAILAITLPIITIAAVFLRNYIISGSLRGFNQASPERSYLEAFTGTMEMIFQQFQISKSGFFLIILLMMLCFFYILINAHLRKEILKYFHSGLDLIILFQISYTALIVITMAKQAWRFELRYVSPLVPFLFISIIFIFFFIWDKIIFKRFSKLSLVGLILSLSIIAFGSFYKTFLNLPEFSYKQEKAYALLDSCTYKWTKENYKKNIIIATNKPFHLSFFGGYSTIALPHKRFDPTIHIPEDMGSVLPDRMIKFGSRVLVLFDEAEDKYDGGYIAKLFNKKESDDKFALVYECRDGVVYNLH